MVEENSVESSDGAESKAEKQQFAVQRIYLKDMSFETPMGVEAFKQKWKPKVNQELNTKTKKLDEQTYEVVLTLTITVKIEENSVFLAEVQQAGLFLIKGIEDKLLPQVLNTACPQILFPYAREVVDNVATKGSFPPLMLPPINFDVLFAQALAQAKSKSEQGGDEASIPPVNLENDSQDLGSAQAPN